MSDELRYTCMYCGRKRYKRFMRIVYNYNERSDRWACDGGCKRDKQVQYVYTDNKTLLER